MPIRPIHDPQEGPLRVIGLMSGSGSNLRRILEHQHKLQADTGASPFELVALFSDCFDSQAPAIGKDFDLPVVIRDINGFYRKRGAPKRDLSVRAAFDRETVEMLAPFGAKVAAYGGYMSVATAPLMEAFLGVNVHPADLSATVDGNRRWTGDHAVRDAIVAGEKTIASTTHIIEPEVDGGRILMISSPLEVEIPAGADLSEKNTALTVEDQNQERLKEAGDWVIFPKTLEYIATGRYGVGDSGLLHFDGEGIPEGLRLEK
jgi:phosphoribosylglycinamide formyltransferase 1